MGRNWFYFRKFLAIGMARFFVLFPLILFFLVSTSVNAAIYYVSSSGNDANSGMSESLAWKTLQKVNSIFFKPGDQILFKRGDSWNGTLNVNSSGLSGVPITYGAFGNGDKPKIYGSETISGWTNHVGNIYKTTLNFDVNQIFLNDKRAQLARYPKTGYLKITSVSSPTQFTSTDLNNSIDYTGCQWVGRTSSYTLIQKEIISSSGQTLTLNEAPFLGLNIGEGFFLCDKLSFLTQPGEWHFDSKTKTLYLWTPTGESPSNYVVRASTYEYGINIESKNNIIIKDLEILQNAKYGIYINKSNYVTIEGNKIISSVEAGVNSYNLSSYSVINNNEIIEANHFGINLYNNVGAEITNNLISGIGKLENITRIGKNSLLPSSWGISIKSVGGFGNIQYNQIANGAYIGIWFGDGKYTVKNNFIDGACQVLDDGGGIYTYNGSDYNKPGAAGSEIANNIILNVFGNPIGNTIKYYQGQGIFLDNGTHDVTVKDNLISGTTLGLFIHDGGKNIITGNTIMNSMLMLFTSKEYEKNTFTQNILYTTDRRGHPVFWGENTHQRFVYQSNAAGIYNYNTYVCHYTETDVFVNKSGFSQWKSDTGQDANSTYDGSDLAVGEKEELFYNNTKQTKVINLGSSVYRDLNGTTVKGYLTLDPFTSKILIKTLIVTSIDNLSPIITNFTIPQTYSSLSVPVINFIATDNIGVTGYKISESASVPLANDVGWTPTAPVAYSFSSEGSKTLYAWVKDAAGNISASSRSQVIISLPSSTITNTIGNTDVYDLTSTTPNRRAVPVTFNEPGVVNSISIFHNGGSGNVLLAIYTDQNGVPSSRLATTFSTQVNSTAGWQTIPITTPVNVSAGQKVWLTFVFQSNPGIRYKAGTPGRAHSNDGWTSGMPEDFGPSSFTDYTYSIYCGFQPEKKIANKTLGNTDVYTLTSTTPNRRAVPVIFNEPGIVNSISIFHNGGTGNVLLGIYSDQNGTPSSRLATTLTTQVNSTEGWQTIPITTPVNVTADQKVWLTFVFQSNPGIRYIAGNPARAHSNDGWTSGMPENFGISSFADYTYSIYCTYSSENWTYTPDTSKPNISNFSVPLTYSSLTVPVTSFIATDNIGVTGYKISESASMPIANDSGWTTIAPINYTFSSEGTKTLYAWVKDAAGNISTGFSSQVTITLPTTTITKTIGNTEVYGLTSTTPNRRSVPVTLNESGVINSISIFHNGGFGNVLLGIYSDQNGVPSSRLTTTLSTPVNSTAGWQTIPVITPVNVSAGQRIWLTFVFQSNPGIRYTAGTPARAHSVDGWSSGMPEEFGISSFADFTYSIYCTYSKTITILKEAKIEQEKIQNQYLNTVGNNLENKILTSTQEYQNSSSYLDFTLYPNPANNYFEISYNQLPEDETKVLIFDSLGNIVFNKTLDSKLTNINIENFPTGIYYINSISGKIRIVKKLIIMKR